MSVQELVQLAQQMGMPDDAFLESEYLMLGVIQNWLWGEHKIHITIIGHCTTNEVLGFDADVHRMMSYPVQRTLVEGNYEPIEALALGIEEALKWITNEQ